MTDDATMMAGEFAAAARLSAKALRIYAQQGLLVPARIEPTTGYRYYTRDQVRRARLISQLRALDLPLRRIEVLVELPAEARAAELRAWLAAQEESLRHRQDLVTAMTAGHSADSAQVCVRQVAEHRVLSIERRVHVNELETFVADAQSRIRTHARGAGVSTETETRVHFHGMVTRDSDGPVEVTVAIEGSVAPVDDLRLRVDGAHVEAYISVREADAAFPGILGHYEVLEQWIDENNHVCAGAPVEIFPGAGGSFLDIAYPLQK